MRRAPYQRGGASVWTRTAAQPGRRGPRDRAEHPPKPTRQGHSETWEALAGAAHDAPAPKRSNGGSEAAATGTRPRSVANELRRRSRRSPGAARGATATDPMDATSSGAQDTRLYAYAQETEAAFDRIEACLKAVSAEPYDRDFVTRAQRRVREQLGFPLNANVLEQTWIQGLDIPRLYAEALFRTANHVGQEFFHEDPLGGRATDGFQSFIEACGFHAVAVAPCADGRLAHLVSYVLRLPHGGVHRQSFAGALFDVEEAVDRWTEVELRRFREGQPNTADAPTRYLQIATYHYSSSGPEFGCAAHGGDERKAARAALDRLDAFRTAIQNSFCCGASIDLLLIGMDTDTDTIRLHLPDAAGTVTRGCYVDTAALEGSREADAIETAMARAYENAGLEPAREGMRQFIAHLARNNLAHRAYVHEHHNGRYSELGHGERFIAVGSGFYEFRLRNLAFFAHMDTVEEGANDLDVGIGLFEKMNVARGLPIPIVLRYEYSGSVPGSRERAAARCERVSAAIAARYPKLWEAGRLHLHRTVRDGDGHAPPEILGSTVGAYLED